VVHVNATAASGQSPEDAARKARYEALSGKVRQLNEAPAQQHQGQAAIKKVAITKVAIAQHADDQIETLLLALSRGAGLPGLSGMPASWQRGGIEFVRPLLGVTSHDIRTWLADQGLKARQPGDDNPGRGWVEDPTNVDTQFTRNRIRHALIPALDKAFPQFRQTFARSAAHAAEAQSILVQVAIEDMAQTGNPPRIAALQGLSPARQGNLLRHWLKSSHQSSPSTAQLAELQSQIANCTDRGKQLQIKIASGQVERRGDVLAYLTCPQSPYQSKFQKSKVCKIN
jgi:tRNA(Ile)-lysidine synthase